MDVVDASDVHPPPTFRRFPSEKPSAVGEVRFQIPLRGSAGIDRFHDRTGFPLNFISSSG
jgi:hypothetical protein